MLCWVNIINGKRLKDAITNNLKEVSVAKEIMHLYDTIASDITCWLEGEQDSVAKASIKAWLDASVAPALSDIIQLEIEKPMATLHSMFRRAETLEKKLAAGMPEDVADITALCKAMLEDEAAVAEAAVKVEAVTAGAVAVQRMQFVIRFIYLLMSVATVFVCDLSQNLCDAAMQAAIKLDMRTVTFDSWAKAAADQFPSLTADWHLEADVEAIVKRGLTLCAKVQDTMLTSMNAQNKLLAREIKDKCPGKALVESSKVLVDAALRATLLKESAAINSSKLLTVAGEILQMMTKYKDESVTKHLKGGQDALLAARRHGRVCVAVSWAVSEITNLTTTALSPDDMVSGAEMIKEKLRIKGFGIHQASSKCDVYQHQSVYTH
jgi:hypothetical protein